MVSKPRSSSPAGLGYRLNGYKGFGNELLCRGVAKLVKASDFDSDMRGFESFLPCQIIQ